METIFEQISIIKSGIHNYNELSVSLVPVKNVRDSSDALLKRDRMFITIYCFFCLLLSRAAILPSSSWLVSLFKFQI